MIGWPSGHVRAGQYALMRLPSARAPTTLSANAGEADGADNRSSRADSSRKCLIRAGNAHRQGIADMARRTGEHDGSSKHLVHFTLVLLVLAMPIRDVPWLNPRIPPDRRPVMAARDLFAGAR